MVACLLIPGFELRAALRARPRLALVPAALAPEAGEEPLLGPVTAAAEAAGVKPGMRLGEALATCPSLVLVDRDPAAVEREWEGVLRRLEDAGFAVDPVEQGAVVFETKRSRAPLRRRAAGARARARGGRLDVGSARRRSGEALHRPRGGERRASWPDPHGRGEGGRGVPRAASALAASDDAESLRGARGSGSALARGAGAAARRRGRGTAGGGGEAGVAARPRRPQGARAWAQAGLGARRGTHLPRSDCERDHAATGARLPPRAPARASRTGRAAVSKTRAGRPARRRRLLAAGRDVARRDGRDRPGCARHSGRSLRRFRRRSSSSASRRSSSRSTRGSSSRSSSRPGRRTSCACAKGCGRCVRARGRGRCAQWWRLRRGRGFRKRERWSFRGTTSGRLMRRGRRSSRRGRAGHRMS